MNDQRKAPESDQPAATEIWRLKKVKAVTGFEATSSLYAAMARGEFPRPVRLSGRSVGWKSTAVQEWIASRTEAAA